MNIHWSCRGCGKRLWAPGEAEGERVRCSDCKETDRVPAFDGDWLVLNPAARMPSGFWIAVGAMTALVIATLIRVRF